MRLLIPTLFYSELLTTSPRGPRICLTMLDRMASLFEAEESTEEGRAFDIGYAMQAMSSAPAAATHQLTVHVLTISLATKFSSALSRRVSSQAYTFV